MKRHPALIPFSREHQSALILAYCLKHGRSSNPKYPWPTDSIGQRDRVLSMFKKSLAPHFEAEETFFFKPLLPQVCLETQQLIEEILAEHEALRTLISEMEDLNSTEVDLAAKLKAFGLLLASHVHKEERQLFEKIQAEVDSTVLLEMQKKQSES